MVGTSVSHYKVTEKIGEGGMGEGYHAEDTMGLFTSENGFLPHKESGLIMGDKTRSLKFRESG